MAQKQKLLCELTRSLLSSHNNKSFEQISYLLKYSICSTNFRHHLRRKSRGSKKMMQAKRKDTPPQKANGSSFSRLDKIKNTA